MSEPTKPTEPVQSVVRQPVFCDECHVTHAFSSPKFSVGQRVRVVSGDGYNHKDKVGQETIIVAVVTLMEVPCDEVEYITDMGFGTIRESRLEAV
jgi:hypothetical protein